MATMRIQKHLIIYIFIFALFFVNENLLAQNEDPWSPFYFLLGNWSGLGSGQPGETSKSFTSFTYELDKKIIIRKSRSEFAPKSGEQTGMVHEDLLIIYRLPGSQQFKAIYFDNEGHAINYTVTTLSVAQQVIFVSDSTGQGPRFQLVYESMNEDRIVVDFLIAPPSGEFKSYIKGIIERKK